jgi:hypothetical protein
MESDAVTGYFRQGPIGRRCTLFAIAFCSFTLAASCGRSKSMEIKNKLPVFPVHGTVTINGKPAPEASLTFLPIDPFPKDAAINVPRAITGEDGSFVVSTYGSGDGAPAGRYRVIASWKGSQAGVHGEQREDLPELLPKNYQNPRGSRLRAEVKAEGENELPTFKIADAQEPAAPQE